MSGALRPSSTRRRIVSLLVLALMIVAPLGWAAWASYAAVVTAGNNAVQAQTLAGLRDRLARLGGAQTGEPIVDPESVFLPGETPAIAGAALQKLVADGIGAAGGRVVQSEFTQTEGAADDPGRVDLRVSFDAEIVSLQKILFELETRLPILIVRGLTVQSAGADQVPETESPPLRVIMVVGGYWEAAE
jgi:hypothetical protein